MRGAVLIAGIVLSLPACSGEAVAAPPEAEPTSRVIAETQRPATPAAGKPAPVTSLRLRAYPGLSPAPAGSGTTPSGTGAAGGRVPLGIDLGVSLVTCPDGNREVSALDIGGWLLAQQPACLNRFASSRLSVRGITGSPASHRTMRTRQPAGRRTDGPDAACRDGSANCIRTQR